MPLASGASLSPWQELVLAFPLHLSMETQPVLRPLRIPIGLHQTWPSVLPVPGQMSDLLLLPLTQILSNVPPVPKETVPCSVAPHCSNVISKREQWT